MLGGVISFKVDHDLLDIHRLMVHPDYFRQGIAQILLDFVEAENTDCETLIVSTGSRNAPAVRFYEKNGFVTTDEISLSEGILITSFKKHHRR
ncbi:N-acetyltransferase [Sporosarcina sp.]|uniref:GNAT family N-acetyltransferase n=1 Tax=Sporosarcina sp. TaxID=49982 RepID=UPI0026213E1C|nr:GNAT family N-acetyltransferase [Sporosarcina sp.]